MSVRDISDESVRKWADGHDPENRSPVEKELQRAGERQREVLTDERLAEIMAHATKCAMAGFVHTTVTPREVALMALEIREHRRRTAE